MILVHSVLFELFSYSKLIEGNLALQLAYFGTKANSLCNFLRLYFNSAFKTTKYAIAVFFYQALTFNFPKV